MRGLIPPCSDRSARVKGDGESPFAPQLCQGPSMGEVITIRGGGSDRPTATLVQARHLRVSTRGRDRTRGRR